MADDFNALGFSDALVSTVAAAGYDRPTPLQAASAAVLRRGGNVVLHASPGAGVTAAYALPLIDRLSQQPSTGSPRALVLAPTQQRAEAIAEGIARHAHAAGIEVRALAPGWRDAGGDIVVAAVGRALEAVQTSELKLDGLQAVIITDAADTAALGGGALETLITQVPKDAQRVVTGAKLDGAMQEFIEAHARRALTIPPRPAAPPRVGTETEPAGQIGYMIVEERTKEETLARLLASVDEAAAVYVRDGQRALRVREFLQLRGIAGASVLTFHDEPVSAARVVSYDVPFSAEQLRAVHRDGGTVMVTPSERAHLRRLAEEVQFTTKQRRARSFEAGLLDSFRGDVRDALQKEDLDAQLLVLEPLLREHAPEEVAAALSALLRRRAPAAAAPGAVPPAPAGAQSEAGFTRLFVSVGSRDNIRPGDIVGAITGEANIKGDQVGRVDIRESFSVVEVAGAVAERVIRALNGTTMRGRSLRVDFDRKGAVTGGARQRPGSRDRGAPRERKGPPRRRPPES